MPTETAPRSKQRTLYIPDSTYAQMGRMAMERDMSISRLLCELVELEAKRAKRRKVTA